MPHPDGADASCIKKIPKGWTADEGHGGGHMWMDTATADLVERGHFNAQDALSGLPFGPHDPADCGPHCPRYWDGVEAKAAPAADPEEYAFPRDELDKLGPAEAGIPQVVTDRGADDCVRAAGQFVDVVAVMLGV